MSYAMPMAEIEPVPYAAPSHPLCVPVMYGVFFGTLALGAYVGQRAAPKHRVLGAAFGTAVFFLPAGIGAYMLGTAACGGT